MIAFSPNRGASLFQRGIDRGELVIQVGAKAIDRNNNRNRNARRDQSVFDGSSAGLIVPKLQKVTLHVMLPRDAPGATGLLTACNLVPSI
jgi:hypothetical protein